MKLLNFVCMSNALTENLAIAEEQSFELVQHNKRLKSLISVTECCEICRDLFLNMSSTRINW